MNHTCQIKFLDHQDKRKNLNIMPIGFIKQVEIVNRKSIARNYILILDFICL